MRLPFLLAPGWPRVLLFVCPPLLAGCLLTGAVLFGDRPAPPAPAPVLKPAAAVALPPAPGLLVHVVGAVAQPGMYRLNKGDRVYAAISAAGGLAPDADPARLPDLAGRLRDGEQVKVPTRGSGTASRSPSKVSLSTASAEQLATLPGFTPDLVDAVLQYRDDFGGFRTTRELVTALGMGQAEYNAVKKELAP